MITIDWMYDVICPVGTQFKLVLKKYEAQAFYKDNTIYTVFTVLAIF